MEERLVVQAQRGDMRAFEELVHRYDGKVLSIAIDYTGDADEAKDVYQEVFIRVFRALPRFRRRSSFSTWLYRIAVNVCKTHHSRRLKRKQVSLDQGLEYEDGSVSRLDLPDEANDAERTTLNSELARHMRMAIDGLSPKQKLIFTLRHYHGFKLREIAEMMRCAEGTVKRHLFTATQRLRERLKVYAD